MNEASRKDAAWLDGFVADLKWTVRLYRNPDGSRYVASAKVHAAKQNLAGFNDGTRLWREDIPALMASFISDTQQKDPPDAVGWLGILVQYTQQIRHHTMGSYPPHCSHCERSFALGFLPEVIVTTRDITDPQVDIAATKIGGMCRDCVEDRFTRESLGG